MIRLVLETGRRLKRLILGALLFLTTTHGIQAQTVSNVWVQQEGQQLVIHYHLETKSPCKMETYLSENGGSTWALLQAGLSGDVSEVRSGDHAIVWNVLSSREQLVGSDFVFKVKSASVENALKVGQEFQGGIVAYIFQSTDAGYKEGEVHGLIVATKDLKRTYNFKRSVAKCKRFSSDSFSDWFLPSFSDWDMVMDNWKFLRFNKAIVYWTSSDCTFDNFDEFLQDDYSRYGGVWTISINNGFVAFRPNLRNQRMYVRPFRSF